MSRTTKRFEIEDDLDYVFNHEIFEGPPPPLFFSPEERLQYLNRDPLAARLNFASLQLDPAFC